MTLAELLYDMGSIFESVTGYFTDVFEMFVSNPLLLLTFGVGFVAIVINMARGFLGR
jgi:hypothetical protein